jgi:copper transport protein
MRRPRRIRWPAAALTGLLLGLLAAVCAPATAASAHATLVRTSPSAESIVDGPPAEVVLIFSEPVRPLPSRIRVIGPDGQRVEGGARSQGARVRIPVRADARTGTYLVSYRVISADSHPLGGAFTFSVGAPSDAPTADAGVGTDPTVVVALASARFVGYAGLVLLVGPIVALLLFWPSRLPRVGPARLAVAGLGLLTLSTLAELFLEAPYSTGEALFAPSGGAYLDVLVSQYGLAHEIRLGVLVAIAVLLPTMLRGPSTDGRPQMRVADQAVLVFLAVVGLATWPLAGHSAYSAAPALTVPADMAHLAAMSFWLGGLVTLVTCLLRHATVEELDSLLPAWSRSATWAVAVLASAGVAQAIVQIGTFDGLATSSYGRLVLAKLGLFAVIVIAAAYARRLVHTGAAGTGGRRVLVRRAVLVEVITLAVVLGVTSALVQTPPATAGQTTEAAGQEAGRDADGSYEVRLTSPLYSVQVYISPAQPGDNTVSMFAFTPANAPLNVVEWTATATLAVDELGPISMALSPAFASHAVGRIHLPRAGAWELRLTLRTSEIDQATVSTTVPIEG